MLSIGLSLSPAMTPLATAVLPTVQQPAAEELPASLTDLESPPSGHLPVSPRTIWSEFLASRPTRHGPGNTKIPIILIACSDMRAVLRALLTIVDRLSPQQRHLHVESLGSFSNGLKETIGAVLGRSPRLEEVRLTFLDGRVAWASRSRSNGRSKITSKVELCRPTDVLFTGDDLPAEHTKRIRLLEPWLCPNKLPSLHRCLRQLRSAKDLSRAQVAEALRQDAAFIAALTRCSPEAVDADFVGRVERKRKAPPPFPLLRALARLYGVDLRNLIAASNRMYFQEVPEALWTTDYYPLYLRGDEDRRRMTAYQSGEPHRARGSLGWLIMAARKNPYRYREINELAQETGLSSSNLSRWELNGGIPNWTTLSKLARALSVDISELIAASNATHYPDLPLAELFPGQSIYVEQHSEDADKIRTYQDDPGSPGQYLFAYRKAVAPDQTLEKWARRCGVEQHSWSNWEYNRVAFDRSYFHEWVWRFDRITQLDLLKALLEERHGIPRDDPAYTLAEAMEGRSVEWLSQRAAVERLAIANILRGKTVVPSPETLKHLQAALPELDGAHLYRVFYPSLGDFFPEALEDSPRLNLASGQIEEALTRFHLGIALFTYRMDYPGKPLPVAHLAKQLGVTTESVLAYEAVFRRVQGTQLRGLAELLGVDPRILYLHFYPEILSLFEIADPHLGEGLRLDRRAYRHWIKRAADAINRTNYRDHIERALARHPVWEEQGSGNIAFEETLAAALDTDRAETRRLLKTSRPLSWQELLRLSQALPGFSYRAAYEHFNRPALAYFLGYRHDRVINYALPAPLTRWQDLEKLDIGTLIRASWDRASLTSAQRKQFEDALSDNLRRKESLTDIFIARLARHTDLDPRLLFMWARRQELRPIMTATASSPRSEQGSR